LPNERFTQEQAKHNDNDMVDESLHWVGSVIQQKNPKLSLKRNQDNTKKW
jgi:hypothetical protein